MTDRTSQPGQGKGPNNIGKSQQSQHGSKDHMGDKSHGAGAKDHPSKGHSTK